MKRATALLAAYVLASTAAATAAAPSRSASVTSSSYSAGAKPVALTFRLTYEMQCDNPGKSLVVSLPAAMSVPTKIPPSAVLVNGSRPASVSRSGPKITVSIGESHWLTCKTLNFGSLTVVIGRKAGLGNPKAKGIYGFGVAVGAIKGTPQLRII